MAHIVPYLYALCPVAELVPQKQVIQGTGAHEVEKLLEQLHNDFGIDTVVLKSVVHRGKLI